MLRRSGRGWIPDPLVIRARLLSRVVRPTTPPFAMGLAVGACLIAVETLAVVVLQRVVGQSLGGFGLCYMFGVLVVSAVWGAGLSLTMTMASAIAFGFFHARPYSYFGPFTADDWLAIALFLLIALLANTIAAQARVGERFFALSSDLLCITEPDNVIRVNAACTRILGYSEDEIASRPWIDFVVPEDRGEVRAVFDELVGSSEPVHYANRVICRDGSHRYIEWSVVWFRGLFYAVGRDVTERHAKEDQLRGAHVMLESSRDQISVLAEQQAALRRVATLVARGVSPSQVFSAVAEEMANCLNVQNADVFRYEDEGAAIVVVASYAAPGVSHHTVGERLTTEGGDNVSSMVWSAGRVARMDSWEGATGPIAERVRQLGMRSRIGAPIVVDERVWGMAIVGTTEPHPLPMDIEERVAEFAELAGTAIAAATARADLIASRARIVAAADDARRRLERDLHDGAQQQLVSLGLQARMAEGLVSPEQTELRQRLDDLASGLTSVSTELREISRGIHPAILSEGGLGPALKSLARRSTLPVNFNVAIERRLSDAVEIAAYYVVAEALTNAVKHSQASQANVRAEIADTTLRLSIEDNGIGGADVRKGSGLIGLKDRVEALAGHLRITSRPGSGTSLDIAIQLDDDVE